MDKVHKRCVSSVLPSLQCFKNRKILPFSGMSTRKYSDVVSGRREEACSSDDTHSWLRNYQRENEAGKTHLDVPSK